MIKDIAGRLGKIIGRAWAQKGFRDASQRYRLLFENLNDAAFLADAETGIILEANRRAEALLGRWRAEIVGMHQSQLHPPEKLDEYREKFAAHVRNEHTVDFDAEIIRKHGMLVPVVISASTITLDGKRLILGLFRDITERKRMEEDLRRRVEFERLASSISTNFIRVGLDEGRRCDTYGSAGCWTVHRC